ncbi:MAG: hypothetical protein A4E32_01609 [Methanomassiliicoccales archaeon PtaU1.Bin124]|nr:MAG: hypothetical protein A4E32_01609 [Methanomassiliicoccales archaeon PtaU1.Bin124]
MENPFVEESQQIKRCQSMDLNNFFQEANSFFDIVQHKYRRADLDVSFFRKALADHESLQKEPFRLSAIKESFERDWSARLSEKQMKWEMEELDKARAELCKDLYAKAENFMKLKEAMQPFSDYLETGRLWDMSHGVWRKTDFNVLNSYAQFLEKEKEIRELAEMLGRLREAEDEAFEEEVKQTVIVQGWTTEHASKSELVGVHESDDLSALLPSEVALLSDGLTESIFFKKFAEKKLLTFDYSEKVSQQHAEEISSKEMKKKPKDKGPIIVCIDTSGSMKGTPEHIAKLMCFALMQIAIRDKRKCYLVNYSHTTATLDLSDLSDSIPRLIDFLTMSFHGGNNEEAAFSEILSQLDKGDFSNSDVVFISDFITQDLGETTKAKIAKTKQEKNTKFHSLIISHQANPDILGIFDNNWLYDHYSDQAILNLAKDIRSFQKS